MSYRSNFDEEAAGEAGYSWQEDWQLVSCVIAAGLLILAAVTDKPDGFYTFLRIYVSGLSLVLTVSFAREKRALWAVATAIAAILFNPVVSIEMDREEWLIYDLVAAAAFIWIAVRGPSSAIGVTKLGPAVGLSGAAAAALFVYSQNSESSYDENMVVENLTAENLVVENDIDWDSSEPEWSEP